MIIMLIGVGILFGIVFFIKYKEKQADKKYREAHRVPIFVVSAMKVLYVSWAQLLKGSGSLRTVKGVNVTTQLAGMVRNIYFSAGSYVHKGQLLVLLNIDPDVAKLVNQDDGFGKVGFPGKDSFEQGGFTGPQKAR